MKVQEIRIKIIIEKITKMAVVHEKIMKSPKKGMTEKIKKLTKKSRKKLIAVQGANHT
jgi:hypothetical protein